MAEGLQQDIGRAAGNDILTAILRKWWLVMGCAVAGGILGYVLSRSLLPKVYEAQGTVYVQQASPLAGALRDLPVTLTGKTADPAGYMITVLQSDTMLRRVSSRLRLSTLRSFTSDPNPSEERVQRDLKRCLSIRQDKNGAVFVSARTRDPELCARIVNQCLDNLGELFVTQSQGRAEFINKKLADTNKRLHAAEDALLAFQNTHNVALIDEQTKNVIAELGELDGRLMTQSVELEQVKVELENGGDLEELVKLRVRKKALETSRGIIARKIETVRNQLATAPLVSIQYARLQRTVAMLSKTADLLTEQGEIAAITQHGKDGDYRVVDWAQVKHEPVGPRNAVNGAVVAALFGCLAVAAIAARRSPAAPPSGKTQ